jgi:uncharacterized membrane protein
MAKNNPVASGKKVVKPKSDFAFGRINYILMLAGLGLIILGFILMAGGKSNDPNVFNPEIFSFRRITLAPIIVMAGFVLNLFAILKKSKD